MEKNYDTKVQTKINACKSNCLKYRVIIEGKKEKSLPDYKRLTIVVTKEGKFAKNYWG